MAYRGFGITELRTMVKERFNRKNLEREARDIKLNKSAAALRQILVDADRNPPVANNIFLQKRQQVEDMRQRQLEFRENIARRVRQQESLSALARQAREKRIEKLRDGLAGNPVRSFNELWSMNYNFSPADVERLFQNGNEKYYFTVKMEGGRLKHLTLLHSNFNFLRELVVIKRWITANLGGSGSDTWGEYVDEPIESIHMDKVENRRGHDVRRENAFFRFLNTTNIPLEDYQIYTKKSQVEKKEEENQNCLIFTLSKVITIAKTKELLLATKSLPTTIGLSDMKRVAEIIKKKIVMYYYDENTERNRPPLVYGKEFEETIEIAQFKNHIFTYEQTNYTRFYINHYHEIEKFERESKTKIKDKTLVNRKQKQFYSYEPLKMTSLDLVVLMYKNDFFSSYNVVEQPSNNHEVIPSLENIEENQSPVVEENFTTTCDNPIYIFADCESDVSKERHEMIAFGFSCNRKYTEVIYKGNKQDFIEDISDALAKACFKEGLKKVEKTYNRKVIIFFHNVKYDSHLFQDMFYSSGEVCKDGQIYSKTYYIKYGIRVEFRDSYKHFGGKLADASKTFNLPTKKQEACNYRYHTLENISSNDVVKVDIYAKGLKSGEKEVLIKNLQKEPLLFRYDGKSFNPSAYYLYYLRHDVQVLEQAMHKYRELINKITGLDAFNFLTISSIGYNFAKSKGCFKDLWSVKGCLREFIQKAIRGGRVYVNPNPLYQCQEINENIEDFDGVSLYPSSMLRLCTEYGLPIGEIKKGEEHDKSYYDYKSWYIVRIKINEIRKKQQIPCISMKIKTTTETVVDGKTKKHTTENLRYINEIDKPTEFYVDKLTLEDWIMYHDIDYEIIEGIYWDQGFNKCMGDMILHLHKERNIHKADNKPLADMIKLIMNSIYGKTGQRSSETKTSFIKKDKFDQYLYDHFGKISEWEENTFNYKVTERMFDDSYSLNYVACNILSMSKRIMNEVFSLMNDNEYPVYYTDTDSIHMLQKDVIPLSQKYKDKFSRDLIGKNLGQFHTDFDMPKNKLGQEYDNVFSIKHIPIRPKIYLDVLQGTNTVTGEIEYDTHCRIKGITKAGLRVQVENRMKEKSINKIQATLDLFNDLKNGKRVDFVMNPTDHDVCFEFSKDGVKTKKLGWVRSIKLGENDEETDSTNDLE